MWFLHNTTHVHVTYLILFNCVHCSIMVQEFDIHVQEQLSNTGRYNGTPVLINCIFNSVAPTYLLMCVHLLK